MKIEFFENDFGVSFELKPESVEEVATLARIAKNSKATPPDISFYFGGTPACSIWIKKIKKVAQRNSINNRRSG